jgi:UDP-glucose 4-epimerase
MNILVTGGAGFIGSHLIDSLLDCGHTVVCVDDLSLGTEENIRHHYSNPRFAFIKLDILQTSLFNKVFLGHRISQVFHLAANSDIQGSAANANLDLEKTFMTTFTTLECMHKNNVQHIVFASSSTIYGEQEKLLAEDTGPLFPISFYGAAKLSSEAFISAFCEQFGMKAWIFRFPNVVGGRATHGALFDFVQRLRENPRQLVILGDGTQHKPYLYVKDLVEGILFGWQHSQEKINCFNLGVDSSTAVTRIAEMVVEEMGLEKVKFIYTGGSRGWIGDVPTFKYSLEKINALGWKAQRSSDEAVRLAVKAVLGKVR